MARTPRLSGIDWKKLARALDESGYARLPGLLEPSECGELAALYGEARRFRKRVVMEQHRFGAGEYQYFAYPLPRLVRALPRAGADAADAAAPALPGGRLQPPAPRPLRGGRLPAPARAEFHERRCDTG